MDSIIFVMIILICIFLIIAGSIFIWSKNSNTSINSNTMMAFGIFLISIGVIVLIFSIIYYISSRNKKKDEILIVKKHTTVPNYVQQQQYNGVYPLEPERIQPIHINPMI